MPVTETRSVLLCTTDKKRLQPFIDTLIARGDPLFDEIDNATVVSEADMPSNIVRMNSAVQVEDLDTGEILNLSVVYPNELDGSKGQVSIIAPVGAALIGLKEGEEIEWPLPYNKKRRLRVVSVTP
tara:strand:+ start:6739 stop:7116 length:378 start_codon:yes stop_codon:yes gene_type:complete